MPKNKEKKAYKDRFLLHMPFNLNLILCTVFLNIFGIIMIYSASYYYAVSAYHYSPTHFFKNQLIWVLAGIVVMLLVSYLRPRLYSYFFVLSLLGAAFFLVAVRIPGLGHSSHGAYRWIKIGGMTLQVAEPIKILMIIFLACALTRLDITKRRSRVFIYGMTGLISVGLVILSNNASTGIIVLAIMYFMVMLNYPRQKWFLLTILLGFVLLIAGLILIDRIPYAETENFRITRIRAWLHPTDPEFSDEQAYQATQALYAIASGGFFGKGIGKSILKYTLPEPHNDYILAIVFEELGVFGAAILTYLFVYLLYRILLVYRDCRNRFNRQLVLGIFLHIAVQVLLNYAVTLGIFPTMGVTLPFISAGGSAAFLTLVEIGIVLAVHRQNEEERLYREAQADQEEEHPELKLLKRDPAQRRRVRRQRAGSA
ncbi:MAG: FtsW/RodA/SpoVE family cell cycle protein [Lachnospiraceae bacterium]|nr:FtsW/RodA/SpoVE family cell cycle protein [Lachnospiraceae bacterium]